MDIRPTTSSRRKFLYGSGSVASVIIVLAILVFLAFLADRYYWRWDVNADQSQSLTKITKNIVAEVKEPLKITAFLPEGQADRQIGKELLDNYHYQNRLIAVNIVDPERSSPGSPAGGLPSARQCPVGISGTPANSQQPHGRKSDRCHSQAVEPAKQKDIFSYRSRGTGQ